MYKIILADDEPLIRNNMKKGIPWKEYGFSLEGCCANGAEVLELVQAREPDLIITDINMPYVDGIELARQIYAEHPRVKIVFLTGYNEFEYAKKAMEYGVKEYILKPIDREDICRLLTEMKNLLDSEQDETNRRMELEEFYRVNRALLRSMMVSQILEGKIQAEEVRLRRDMLQMRALESECFQAASVRPDLWGEESAAKIEESKMRLFQRMQEFLEQRRLGFATWNHTGCNVLLCSQGCTTGKYKEEFKNFLEEFRSRVEQQEDFTVTIGVGGLCGSLELVHSSCADADAALKYQDLTGNNCLIYLEDMEPQRDMLYRIPEATAEKILELIKLGNDRALEETVEEYKSRLLGQAENPGVIRLKLLDAVSRISEEILEMGNPVPESVYASTMHCMISAGNIEEMIETFLPFCRQLQEIVTVKRQGHYSAVIEQVRQLVEESYMDPEFGSEQACERLNLSESYFRAVFKKETGHSFGSYLREVRMLKAKELLLTTDLLNYQVAERVGYNNGGYFGYCFKRYFHISPNDMRKFPQK